MKKFSKFFIATIVAMLISSTILSVTPNISEAKKSSLEELRAQQQERQQQQQQQKQQQNLQTQAVTTQSVSEKKPITTDDIADNAVTSPKIKDGEVKTNDLANGAVTKEKLNSNAVKLVVIERTKEFSIPALHIGGENVQCALGEIVTGGGGFGNPNSGVYIVDSHKLNNGWSLTQDNTRDDVNAQSVVSVECAHLELGP